MTRDLLWWEVVRTGRTPVLWTILALLGCAFVWGAINGASLHREQSAAMVRTLEAEAAHRADVTRRVARAAGPAVAGDRLLPAWQDPSDASNFSHYFVFRHAMKPHLPLSPVAVGGSALWPSRLQVAINTPFGFAPSYDFESPRTLALGTFDLGFAIVLLLPLGVLLLLALLVTFERDYGVLRLVAAQAVTTRVWLCTRMTAVLVWTIPTVLGTIVMALAVAGVPLGERLPELLLVLTLILAWLLFWVGIAAAVLSRLPSAAGAIGQLSALWGVLVIGLPLLANLVLTTVVPPPSFVRYVDAERRVADALAAEGNAVVTAAFERHPVLRAHVTRVPAIGYAARLSFLIPETERRLEPLREGFEAHRAREARAATVAAFVVPPLGMETALATLAGTDAVRHADFEQQARAYQQQLRAVLYPIVHHDIATPKVFPSGTYGRLNFTDIDVVPDFSYRDPRAAARFNTAFTMAGWLLLLAAVIGGWGIGRARSWPHDMS